MGDYDQYYPLRHPSLHHHKFGYHLRTPGTSAALHASVTSVQVAARACALHDDDAVLVSVSANPTYKIGIRYRGNELVIEPDGYWGSLQYDPIAVEAARAFREDLISTKPYWDDDPVWFDRLQPHEPAVHGAAARYVLGQWPRITDFANMLVTHGGALNAPDIAIMPPLPTVDAGTEPV